MVGEGVKDGGALNVTRRRVSKGSWTLANADSQRLEYRLLRRFRKWPIGASGSRARDASGGDFPGKQEPWKTG